MDGTGRIRTFEKRGFMIETRDSLGSPYKSQVSEAGTAGVHGDKPLTSNFGRGR